jgi:hypothetical protein
MVKFVDLQAELFADIWYQVFVEDVNDDGTGTLRTPGNGELLDIELWAWAYQEIAANPPHVGATEMTAWAVLKLIATQLVAMQQDPPSVAPDVRKWALTRAYEDTDIGKVARASLRVCHDRALAALGPPPPIKKINMPDMDTLYLNPADGSGAPAFPPGVLGQNPVHTLPDLDGTVNPPGS